MTVETIKQAITALLVEERHALASWLNELDHDAWDNQMVVDFSAGGRGAALVEILPSRNKNNPASDL